MSSIVGLNDGEDEQCKWLKVGRDMQELCRRKPGSRLSVAQQVCRDRDGNVVSDGSSAQSSQLLGREGLRERQALGQIKSIQSLAAQSAQSHRQVEADMFQVRPSKLVAPSQGSPASMFEPSTWAMAFPDLFPWGDGVPFLKRETRMDAAEVFRYLLIREELQYKLPSESELVSAPLPRWSLSVARQVGG